VIGLLAALALYSGQEVQTFNDPFDPYSAVTVSLPDSAVKQQGEPATDPFAYVMTAKVRSTGEIQQYLKLELVYVTAPGLADTVGVDTAQYEGGQEADFEVIEHAGVLTDPSNVQAPRGAERSLPVSKRYRAYQSAVPQSRGDLARNGDYSQRYSGQTSLALLPWTERIDC